jgi:hypothetical protein
MEVDLGALFDSEKFFPAPPQWRRRDRNAFRLVSPLDVEGVTIEGLTFRATAITIRPDESVTFQLEYKSPRQSKGGPFARYEWRPLRGHNNKQIGPVELRNKVQRGSRLHDFWLNWKHSPPAVRKGHLPLSVPCEEPASFEAAVAFVGKAFRISLIEWVQTPPWENTGIPWETMRIVE